MINLLNELRNTECSDARDKVFAAIGFARDIGDDEIVLDYSQFVVDVYVQFVRLALGPHSDDLSFLEYVHIPPSNALKRNTEQQHHPVMPTWVPDWRQPVVARRINSHFIGNDDRNLYKACGDLRQRAEIHGRQLSLVGFMIDAIHFMTDIWDDYDDNYSVLEQWEETISRFDAKISKQIIQTAFVGDLYSGSNWHLPVGQWLIPYQGGQLVGELVKSMPTELSDEDRMVRDSMIGMLRLACFTRRAGITAEGRVAILPGATQKDDQIAIFGKANVPYIVRKVPQKSKTFQIIGGCYVDGLMYGEAARLAGEADIKPWRLTLE